MSLIQHFARFSLLEFDPLSQTLAIHALIRSYVQTASHKEGATLDRGGESAAAHANLIAVEDYGGRFRLSVSGAATGSVHVELGTDATLVQDLNTRLLEAESEKEQVETAKALYQVFIANLEPHFVPNRPLWIINQGRAGEIAWEMMISPRNEQPLGFDPGVTRSFATLLRPPAKMDRVDHPLSALLIADTTRDLPPLPSTTQ